MGILTDVIDELEVELHQLPADVTDETRVWALMAIQARAEQGDEDARARLKAIQELFARAGCPKS